MVDTYFIILQIVQTIFYTFHLTVLILLIFKRNTAFQGPFFNIFRIVIVADFLQYFHVILSTKLPLIPAIAAIYINDVIFASILATYAAYVSHLQFFGHTLMAFNRFTFIWFPIKYTSIWRRHWYTFLLFFLPFLCVCWKLHKPSIFVPLPDGSYILGFNPDFTILYYIVNSTIYIFTTCLAAIFNFFAFIKFYFYKKTDATLQVNEKGLIVVLINIFFAQVWRTSIYFLRVVFPTFVTNPSTASFFAILFPLTYDIFALSGTISLLVLSKSTRKEYATFYFPKFCFPGNSVAAAAAASLNPKI